MEKRSLRLDKEWSKEGMDWPGMEQRGLGLTRDGPENVGIAQGWNREGLDRPGMDQRRLGLTRDGPQRA